MSEASTPIHPGEWLLRRIRKAPGYYNDAKAPPVEPGAFRPTPQDVDGLSLYRETAVSPRELVEATGRPAELFLVVRLLAQDLLDLGLTVVETPHIGELPGHVSIPEINVNDYQDDAKKPGIKLLCVRLAELASRNLVTEW